jgi:GNAT superfamily N-acetyltransferase
VIEIRPARDEEAPIVADLYWRAREAAIPAIPPSVHPLDDVRVHFATVVLPHRDTWLAVEDDAIVGFLALEPGWVDHLYLEPSRTGEGIGTQLLDHAKTVQPDGLDLWAFRANTGARRFYERHGFVAVAFTEGDNEEGAPDVRYHWSP